MRVTKRPRPALAIVIAAALLVIMMPRSAAAQTITPPEGTPGGTPSGPIVGGEQQQPVRSKVQSAEQRTGSTTPDRERQYQQQLDKIHRDLQEQQQRHPPGAISTVPRNAQ